MLFVSRKMVFLEKRGDTTMRNYAETYKGICGYNSMYGIFGYLSPLKRSVFVV